MRYGLLSRISLACFAAVLFAGCETTPKQWFGSHKSELKATADLVAQEAAAIAQEDVFSNAQDAEDALLKQYNTQGFSTALNTLIIDLPRIGIAKIPDFMQKLRKIWGLNQSHYVDLAHDVGVLIQQNIANEEKKLGRPLLPDETKQIISGAIAGLSTAKADTNASQP